MPPVPHSNDCGSAECGVKQLRQSYRLLHYSIGDTQCCLAIVSHARHRRRHSRLFPLSAGTLHPALQVLLSILALLLALALLPRLGRAADSAASPELDQAYLALNLKDYDRAIAQFRLGLTKQSGNAAAHKDLAYTLLKTGDNLEARDEFEAALKLSPSR